MKIDESLNTHFEKEGMGFGSVNVKVMRPISIHKKIPKGRMVEVNRIVVRNRDVNDGVQVPKYQCNILGFESEKRLKEFRSRTLSAI